jgi:hypothetical protein
MVVVAQTRHLAAVRIRCERLCSTGEVRWAAVELEAGGAQNPVQQQGQEGQEKSKKLLNRNAQLTTWLMQG